jgi:hypothetical protein
MVMRTSPDPSLQLSHAPRGDHGRSVERFFRFVRGLDEPTVRLRPEAVIQAAIEDRNLFFLENSDGDLVGTTGIFRHGSSPNLWPEIGATLIHPRDRGFKLQPAVYRYLITLDWLAYWGLGPMMIAITDRKAVDSSKNIEETEFGKLAAAPDRLLEAKPQFDWSAVRTGAINLYQLTRNGVAGALSFVANAGARTRLLNKRTGVYISLEADFTYLKQADVFKQLRSEAALVASENFDEILAQRKADVAGQLRSEAARVAHEKLDEKPTQINKVTGP